jgi:hypothetical protein
LRGGHIGIAGIEQIVGHDTSINLRRLRRS